MLVVYGCRHETKQRLRGQGRCDIWGLPIQYIVASPAGGGPLILMLHSAVESVICPRAVCDW